MQTQPQRRADAQRSVEAILDSARDVLVRDPDAELQEIALRSGLNRSTVYRHFPDRRRLVAAVYDRYVDAITQAIESLDPQAPDVLAELRRVSVLVLGLAVRWRPFRYAATFPETVDQRRLRMGAALVAVMERGLAEGVLRQDMTAFELAIAWGVPLPYASVRIAEGSWTTDEAVDFMLVLVAPRR